MTSNRRDILRAVLRDDFEAFIEAVFLTLLPSGTFVPSWHISALAYVLREVAEGRCTRLAINLPPRHLKSICASVALPAWILGHDPTRSIICASYSEELAKKHARDCRLIMESSWYKALFPGTRLSRRKNTELEITTTKHGFRLTTSVGGTLTGRGADVMIIDDPIKASDGESEAARRAVNDWYDVAALNRLNDKARGAIVIAMHRLHEDDITGHAVERSKQFRVLSLPAIAEEETRIPIGPDRFHTRKAGEALSPEREDLETLARVKAEMGSRAYSAQYQQAPMPAAGNFFKASWLKTYKTPPAIENLRIIHSWDVAMTNRETADYSVGTIWGITGEHHLYLLEVVRGRWELPDLKRQVLSTAERYRPEAILIEDVSVGTALLQEMRRDNHHNFIGCKAEKDKMTRAYSTQTTFEAGNVYLPEESLWLSEFTRELLGFPSTRHDDQVDSVVQFINWQKDRRDVVVAWVPATRGQRSKWQLDDDFLQRASWMDLSRRW